MKTSEFVGKVNALGYEVVFNPLDLEVTNSIGSILLSVQRSNRYMVDTDWSPFEILNEAVQAELFGIAVEYASTNLEEREEEKKYRYVFPFAITLSDNSPRHMCHNHNYVDSGESNGLILDSSSLEHVIESELFHFTDKEVEQYTGKDRALFEACEKIEVVEW